MLKIPGKPNVMSRAIVAGDTAGTSSGADCSQNGKTGLGMGLILGAVGGGLVGFFLGGMFVADDVKKYPRNYGL